MHCSTWKGGREQAPYEQSQCISTLEVFHSCLKRQVPHLKKHLRDNLGLLVLLTQNEWCETLARPLSS